MMVLATIASNGIRSAKKFSSVLSVGARPRAGGAAYASPLDSPTRYAGIVGLCVMFVFGVCLAISWWFMIMFGGGVD